MRGQRGRTAICTDLRQIGTTSSGRTIGRLGTSSLQLSMNRSHLVTLGLAPDHEGVYQRLGTRAHNVAKSLYQLIKGMVCAGTTDGFNSDQSIITLRDTAIDLVIGFADELIQQVVEGIFSYGGGLLLMVLARSRAVMAVIVVVVMV